MVGAWICYVVGIGTPCESARGAVTALPALRALDCSPTCGTLAWTQDGVSLSATVGSLAGAETLDAAMAIINNAIVAAYPVTGANGATLTGSRITTSTCTGITGTIGDGWMNVTAVSGGNCIYPGGLIVETGAERLCSFPGQGDTRRTRILYDASIGAVISTYLQHLYADLQCPDRGDGRLRAAANKLALLLTQQPLRRGRYDQGRAGSLRQHNDNGRFRHLCSANRRRALPEHFLRRDRMRRFDVGCFHAEQADKNARNRRLGDKHLPHRHR